MEDIADILQLKEAEDTTFLSANVALAVVCPSTKVEDSVILQMTGNQSSHSLKDGYQVTYLSSYSPAPTSMDGDKTITFEIPFAAFNTTNPLPRECPREHISCAIFRTDVLFSSQQVTSMHNARAASKIINARIGSGRASRLLPEPVLMNFTIDSGKLVSISLVLPKSLFLGSVHSQSQGVK